MELLEQTHKRHPADKRLMPGNPTSEIITNGIDHPNLDRLLDNLGREAVTGVADFGHRGE
jgi:hypothetical protein